MKPSHFIVQIPEPCHENWNAMLPDAKGKFCNSCNKSVFDFTAKTDLEIKTILLEHKGEKVCGHFNKTQINRPLNISINIKDLPRNVSITKAFAIALFLVFGTFLFSCTNDKGKAIDNIEVIDSNFDEKTLGEPSYGDTTSVLNVNPSLPDSIVTQNYELYNVISGGISYEEVTVEEKYIPPTEPIPIESRMVGMVAYSISDCSFSVPKTISADSTNAESLKIIEDQLDINSNKLFNVYPNPTSGDFTIKYKLLKRADVTLTIFDMNGALIKTLVNINAQYEGKYQIPVSLSDVPNGIYIVSLINGGTQTTERLVIAR